MPVMVLVQREETWRRTHSTCASAWLRAWDSGMDVYSIATKYEVSRAWVHRLVQRRREKGSIETRKQTTFRHRVLSPTQEERLAALIGRPGCHVGGIAGGVAHHGRAEHAVADDWPLGDSRSKKRTRRRTASP